MTKFEADDYLEIGESLSAALLITLWLYFLQRQMGRVFRCLAIGYRQSQRMQIQTVKQQFPLAEQHRRRHQVQGVDQSGLKILPYRRHPASDLDVFIAGGLPGESQCRLDSVSNKVESRSAFHHQGLTLIVSQN